MTQKLTDLSSFFTPQSVAIVGASEDVIRIGGRPLDYMRRYGFAGKVYPVHPKHNRIQGFQAYASLRDIPDEVELAIIAVPAALVEVIVLEGIEKGCKAFIVFSSGYAELGEAGRDAQVRLADICHAAGALLLGPNCIGCADTGSRLIASFSSAMDTTTLKPGRFGLVTQSGALGSYWMAMVDRQGLGFSKFIATGNEAGVDLAQGIAWLANDQATDVIGVYIESIKDIAGFRAAALLAARAGKTIIAIKAGRSAVGAEAAASHTGALAGEDKNYQAFFDQFGIVRANSLSEMIDTAKLLIHQPPPAGKRIGIVTVSGGAGVLLADELDSRGLITSDFSDSTKAQLNQVLPSYIQARNPLDHTAAIAGNPKLFESVIDIVGQSEDHDAYVVFSGLLDSIADKLVASIKKAFAQSSKQVGVIWLGASAEVIDELEQSGIPVFMDIPQAARAFENVAFAVEMEHKVRSFDTRQWPAVRLVPADGLKWLTEHQVSQRVQTMCNFVFPAHYLVAERNTSDIATGDGIAVRVGQVNLKFPLVAKLQSDAMPHRSEHGGIILNLHTTAQTQEAVETLFQLATAMDIDCEGVLLQEMHEVACELIVGIKNDALFGPVFLVGRGGVDVELRPDVQSALLPLTSDEIKSMVLALESAPLLSGHRGGPVVDLELLAKNLAMLADNYLADKQLIDLEINPLAITKEGSVIALDALASERR